VTPSEQFSIQIGKRFGAEYRPNPSAIIPGKFIRFATWDKQSNKSGYCLMFADEKGGVYGDFRGDTSPTVWQMEGSKHLSKMAQKKYMQELAVARLARASQIAEQQAKNAASNSQIWRECNSVQSGDAVDLYLKNRGLHGALKLKPNWLKIHPSLPYFKDGNRVGNFCAMVCPITTPQGEIVSLHRTFLTDDGKKAPVDSPKKLTSASGPLAGASIKLFEPKNGILGISEGVETSLAATLGGKVPTVAAYCASNLSTFKWPRTVRHLIVFSDHDFVGQKAADEVSERAEAKGLTTRIFVPKTPGQDWCDIYANREARA
jgi:putative DNA primase/helicase